ncbi:hypothetical protein ON010_g18632 [Phytophthora cinnamomi]|nr:hypothetical protein ON010_g18632 [Phytophthora cinnamomi]
MPMDWGHSAGSRVPRCSGDMDRALYCRRLQRKARRASKLGNWFSSSSKAATAEGGEEDEEENQRDSSSTAAPTRIRS